MTGQPTAEIPMLRIPRSAHPVPTTPRLRSAHVPLWGYALLIVAVFAGSILVSRELGWFATTGRGATSLGMASAPGSPEAPGAGAGQGAGSQEGAQERVAPTAGADPADVKGWMTLQQVLDAFPVTKEALYQRFGIPADTSTDTTLSSLKEGGEVTAFDVPALRTWLGEQAAE